MRLCDQFLLSHSEDGSLALLASQPLPNMTCQNLGFEIEPKTPVYIGALDVSSPWGILRSPLDKTHKKTTTYSYKHISIMSQSKRY